MLLPIGTNIKPWRVPYANYALILANVFFFLITYSPHYSIVGGARVPEALRAWADAFMLTPAHPALWQFVTYAFLHGGFMHILGNMFFLYLFGNNVNDKLGNLGYLCFYLAGAVFSGIGHTLLSANPVLGASGAVAAVTGAYLVLFPQTLVTVVYWFIFIGTMDVPAMYFIAFKMIFLDNMLARTASNVAYSAHLAGYAFGVIAMVLMLATGLISASNFDLWAMLRRWNQRRSYRSGSSQAPGSFSNRVRSRRVTVKEIKKTPAQKQQEKEIAHLRTQIDKYVSERNLPDAANSYLQLIGADPTQLPPRQHLLDIANQLASESKHAEAANTYEKFLSHYSTYEYTEQVELMLGIMYSRYLGQPEDAQKHLKIAAEKLTDPGQLKMCNDELQRLR